MRLAVLIAATSLTLGACRDSGEAERNRAADSGLTAENIVANDVTAIDAVTADAANMAADVDYSDALAELANNVADSPPARTSVKPRPRAGAAPGPGQASTNTPAETTTNAQ